MSQLELYHSIIWYQDYEHSKGGSDGDRGRIGRIVYPETDLHLEQYYVHLQKMMYHDPMGAFGLLCEKGSEHQAHPVQDDGDEVSDDQSDNNGTDHVAKHLGVFGIDNFSLWMPLRVVKIVCMESKFSG
jgi:hypothetical protein